jgi:hypothetical protein
MCEGVCLQNEGIQEAVCEDRVIQVERLKTNDDEGGQPSMRNGCNLMGEQVVLHPTANAAER